jgi:hypothetical protein
VPAPAELAPPVPVHPAVPAVSAPFPATVSFPARASFPPPVPAVPGGEPPLPRRVRQASLVDELRIDPTTPPAAPAPPRWDENPLFRPAPRRAGAAIGAFQRRSREARSGAVPPGGAQPGERHPGDTWNTHTIPTREDRS